MSEWQNALDSYQNGIQSVAQDNLQSLEGVADAKIGDVQAQASTLIGKTSAMAASVTAKAGQGAMIAENLFTTGVLGGPHAFGAYMKFRGYRAAGMRSRAAGNRPATNNGYEEGVGGDVSQAPNVGARAGYGVDRGLVGPGEEGAAELQRTTDIQTRFKNLPQEQQAAGQADLEVKLQQKGYQEGDEIDPKKSNDMLEDVTSTQEATEPAVAAANAAKGAQAAASGGGEATDALVGEATAYEGVSETLTAVAPWLAGAVAIVGLGESLYQEFKSGSGSDPYAKIQGQVDAANKQTAQLTANISSDQFASKIGAAAPRYGSLAVPQMDTASQPGVALHI